MAATVQPSFYLCIAEARVVDSKPTAFSKVAIPVIFQSAQVYLQLSEDSISDLPHTTSLNPSEHEGPIIIPRTVRICLNAKARGAEEGSYVHGTWNSYTPRRSARPVDTSRFCSNRWFAIELSGSSERLHRIQAALQNYIHEQVQAVEGIGCCQMHAALSSEGEAESQQTTEETESQEKQKERPSRSTINCG